MVIIIKKYAEKEKFAVNIVAENKSTTMKPLEFSLLALIFILSNRIFKILSNTFSCPLDIHIVFHVFQS